MRLGQERSINLVDGIGDAFFAATGRGLRNPCLALNAFLYYSMRKRWFTNARL